MEKKRKLLLIFSIAVVTLALIAVYSTFFHKEKCSNINCFNSNMANCVRASFINDAEDAAWLYEIKGRKGGFLCFISSQFCEDCVVNVRILQAKKGDVDLEKIKGYDMDCYYPFGYVTVPQSDLMRCHGRLKEEMQELIIKKLHVYIVSNLGEIEEELNKPL